jgi:cytochrome c
MSYAELNHRLREHAFRIGVLLFCVAGAIFVALRGFGFYPGKSATSDYCRNDLADAIERRGHSEEVLWRGCLIASDTTRHLSRFIPAGKNHPSCLSCHDGQTAATFATLWTRFPYRDAQGRMHDLAGAIREEIVVRYRGVPPNRADNVVTALYFYAATKAGQGRMTYAVDTPQQALFDQRDEATPDCRRKFDELGWPRGDNAPAVVRGCNLMTDTPRQVTAPMARTWGSRLTCQSCHRDAGDRANAASIAHGAVLLPHMHTAVSQPIRFDRRVLMCFARSLNWLDFGLDAPEIPPINVYANWLAQRRQLPLGEIPAGRGVPLVYDALGRGASFVAGERVYHERCLGCHGPNGLGGRTPIDGQLPPPLAGPQSFSAAASTTELFRLAGFVQANMPPGASLEQPLLSAQEALDVAAYLTRLGRPADFTKANALEVFGNYLWVSGVTGLGAWLSRFDNAEAAQ